MAVPQNIEELAHQVRTAIYGRDVRESIASSMEATADVADWARSVAQAIIDGSFDEATLNTAIENKLTQLEQDYAPNLTALETEVTNARGTETNLGNRLENVDAQLAETAELKRQGSSLVEKLLSYINPKGIYVTRYTENLGGLNIGVNIDDNLRTVLEYQFRYNGDGLLLLRGVKTGTAVDAELPAVTLNGTFNQNSEPLTYTTTVGDSFTFEFTGTGFIFKRRLESRGGLWEFHLSGGQSKKVSCYSPTTVEGVETTVFEGLPKKKYQVRAIFLGDDKVNPPSTSPSRGYINYIESNPASYPIKTIDDYALIDDNNSRYLVSPNSIPDFAISARPVNATYQVEWVPAHAVRDVSANPAIKVIIDGIDRIAIPKNNLSENFYGVKNIEIIQSFDAVNPNGDDGAMWKHYVRHFISLENPYIEISNRIEILQDTKIDSMYFTMLPVDSSNASRLVLNNGVEYNSIPKDGTDVHLGIDISSAMYAGMYENGRSHATAVDVLSYTEAVGQRYRIGSFNPTRLTFRADNVAKFYLNAFTGTAITGDVFQNTHRIACVSGIKYPNNLLKTI
jgi:hypothetical protein